MKIETQLELIDCPSIEGIRGKLKTVVLVDFSWLLHKSWWGYPTLSYKVGGVEVQTGDIYGVLRSITSIVTRRMNSAILLVLDGSCEFRRKICPQYKAGREDTHKKDIYLKIPEILQALCLLPNVFVTYHPDYEADDVIYTFADRFEETPLDVLIHSSDNDLMQCLSPSARMFSKFNGKSFKYVTRDDVNKKYGVWPEELAIFRALKGDKSDNLPGYKRIPTEFVQQLASKIQTPAGLLELSDRNLQLFLEDKSKSFIRWANKLCKEPELFKMNFELMKLRDVGRPRICRCKPGWYPIDKYGLRSIQNVMNQIIEEDHESDEEVL